MGTSLISIKDVASAQFESGQDWRSLPWARKWPYISRLRGFAPAAQYASTDPLGVGGGRRGRAEGALERLPAARPDRCAAPITLRVANAAA